MLGENHSLICEFPNLSTNIEQLNKEDAAFKEMAADYDELDTQIRELELKNSPTGDSTMHDMKQRRAKLKDVLYQRLTSA